MRKEKSVTLIRQLKSLIGPIIVAAIILVGVLVIQLWQDETEPEEVVSVYGYDGEDTELVLESDHVLFSMDPATTQFTVTSKETGEVWASNPEGAAEDSIALGTEKNKLRSTVLLTYSTKTGVDTLLNNYEFSITKGIYDIETGDDYIKVNYSIGDLEREYIVPLVIEEERLKQYVSQMGQKESLMVDQYYKKYDINNLSKSDKALKDQLVERYPLMETTVIYVLRDSVKANIKTKLEQYFGAVGYTYEEYLEDKVKDKQEQVSEKPVFNVSVIYRLDGDDLLVEVPYDNLEYKEDYPIYNLSVLPYFGASGKDEEGFLFVPEGGGALIKFNNGKIYQNSYYANVYGWDMAQDRDAIVHETQTYFNVFGESKNDSSFICIIEDGAPYASIQADISGKSHSYNYVNAIYSVLHREQYYVAERSTQSMFVYEDRTTEGEGIAQRYRFIDSGDYVDMAGNYCTYLENKYGDYLTINDDTEVPVVVEIIGAVDKVKQVFGVPTTRPLELTTYKEAQGIIEELYEEGLSNMSVKLTGWMNGGVQQKILKSEKLVSDLGNKKDLQNMINSAADKDITVYLDGITNYAIDSDLLDGFFVFTDAAKFVSKKSAKLYEYNSVTYGKREGLDPYYLLKANLIYEMMDNLIETANDYKSGVSFSDIGYALSSDFYRKDPTSRKMAMEEQTEKIRNLDDSGTEVIINMGNDYVIAHVDLATNMDMEGNEYSIIDKKIPFYQMALHGYVNYTGEPVNLVQNAQNEILNAAEYGAGLSFTLMDETTFTLQKTLYTQYFGADYSAWHDSIIEIYTRYNNELGHTFNQKMAGHEFVTDELTCTIYEDGTKVYVNYSYDELQASDGTVIPARDYVVVR
ncbi:MAG: hypothetical protein K0R92_1941 [Lachnospiraceae bacterium]|nr:hypothetical protein [Lachnospiraceae bacterium]